MQRMYRPPPTIDAGNWQVRGLCNTRTVSWFFHPDDDRSHGQRRRREAKAKLTCADCPVRPECAAYALTAKEAYGVWGGLTEAERKLLRRLGWRDTLDRAGRRVDVARLERRLVATRAAA